MKTEWIARRSATQTDAAQEAWFVESQGQGIWNDGCPSVCSEERAHLISAAPDLLKACTIVSKSAKGHLSAETVVILFQAIAKAHGYKSVESYLAAISPESDIEQARRDA